MPKPMRPAGPLSFTGATAVPWGLIQDPRYQGAGYRPWSRGGRGHASRDWVAGRRSRATATDVAGCHCPRPGRNPFSRATDPRATLEAQRTAFDGLIRSTHRAQRSAARRSGGATPTCSGERQKALRSLTGQDMDTEPVAPPLLGNATQDHVPQSGAAMGSHDDKIDLPLPGEAGSCRRGVRPRPRLPRCCDRPPVRGHGVGSRPRHRSSGDDRRVRRRHEPDDHRQRHQSRLQSSDGAPVTVDTRPRIHRLHMERV